jgi:hypothetical protein
VRLELAGNKADGRHACPAGSAEQAQARLITRRVVFEVDLAEAAQRRADVPDIVDRQHPLSARIDVRKCPVGQACTLALSELRH